MKLKYPLFFVLLMAAFGLMNECLSPQVVAQTAPNIGVDARLASDRARRGQTVQGTITMDIPGGYHVNSNRPLEKFLIATQLQIDAPNGLRVGAIRYPRALLRTLKFSKNKVAVFEGRAIIRFSVTVPAKAGGGAQELKGRLRYQSCSDDYCFPPKTREFSLWLNVE